VDLENSQRLDEERLQFRIFNPSPSPPERFVVGRRQAVRPPPSLRWLPVG
jgi:hypothetical protein